MKKLILAGAVAIALGAADRAEATFAFGFSGNADAELIVTLQGGGMTTISTGSTATFNNPVSQGWWSATDGNSSSNNNYITGQSGGLFNNFFIFELGNVSGVVESVALSLFSFEIGGDVTYTLYDVVTPLETLRSLDDNPSASIFNDLGSGVAYSDGAALTPALSSQTLTFSFNAAGIAAVQAALGGTFAVGGSVTGPIDVAVPEPMSLALFGLGLAGLGVALRRRSA